MIRWLLAAAVLFLAACSAFAQKPAALVTDVQGEASSGGSALRLLANLAPQTKVSVAAGARLAVVFHASGDEYRFAGPAEFVVAERAPENLSGNPPQRKALGFAAVAQSSEPGRVGQGAGIMRGQPPPDRLRVRSPRGGMIVDSHPQFSWHDPAAGRDFRVVVRDAKGATLHEAIVRKSSYRLPRSVRLAEGARHEFVVARQSDARFELADSLWFAIATTEQRNAVQRARPRAGAPWSERVAFAAWLERMDYRDAAFNAWRTLTKERPGESEVRKIVQEAAK